MDQDIKIVAGGELTRSINLDDNDCEMHEDDLVPILLASTMVELGVSTLKLSEQAVRRLLGRTIVTNVGEDGWLHIEIQ